MRIDGSKGEPSTLLLEEELRFHPVRRWRFDFAHPEAMVGIEIEGGVWTRGRHIRPQGFIDVWEQYHEAGVCGWSIFRLTPGMITKDILEPIQDFILERLEQKKPKKKKTK